MRDWRERREKEVRVIREKRERVRDARVYIEKREREM